MGDRDADAGSAETSGDGISYEELMRMGIRSCLRTARELHDPSSDWETFSDVAAREVVDLLGSTAEDDEMTDAVRDWATEAAREVPRQSRSSIGRRRFASTVISAALTADADGTRLDDLHDNLRRLGIGLSDGADIIENLRIFLLPLDEAPPELHEAALASDRVAAILAELGRRLDPTWMD